MRATFLLFPAALIVLSMAPVASAEETDDPHLWLEDVEGEQALDWVRARNADSTGQLEAAAGFEATQKRLRAMLDSPDKIHYVSKQGDYLYNVWKGADHPRGLWRRTTVDSYQTEEPVWESVLDVDALGAEEGISWVWGGADCLPPAYDRCLISLSPGGSDADVVREFDVPSLSFVEGGFELPEAKQSVNWIDQDTVFRSEDVV